MNKPGRNDPCFCGSGKKFKQCCMAAAEGAAALRAEPRFDVPATLQTGLQFHQTGRFQEAERCYRQVLSADPVNVDALHFLGVLAHQIGRDAQAAELIEQSVRLDASDPNSHNNLGDTYRALGRYEDALASFQKALALKPDFHEVRNNLGETYRLMGRSSEAVSCFHEVILHKPDYAATHNNLGLTLQAMGDFEAAIACFRQALVLNPQYVYAHNNLGEILRRLQRNDEALACYQKALSLNANFFEAHYNLGIMFKDLGKAQEAIPHLDQALKLKPDHVDAHFNFALVCKQQGYIEQALTSCQTALRLSPAENAYWVLYSEIVKLLPAQAMDRVEAPLLLAALKKEEVDAQHLERIAVAVILKDPLAQRWSAVTHNNTVLSWAGISGNASFISFIEMPLLLAVLEEAIITDYRLEKLLILIRRALLSAVLQPEMAAMDASVERFIASLAQQCFANEYIFAVSPEEADEQLALTQKIAAVLEQKIAVPSAWLMLAATYQALYQCDFAHQIRTDDCQERHVRAVLIRQLSEPLREESLKPLIPRLTMVNNDVSQAVRQQYEESPYPRWRKRGKSGSGQPLYTVLSHLFPHQKLSDAGPEHIEVLVAGCGTGNHSIRSSQRFSDAHILAVDLSLSSLAYARRATEEFGITTIDYRQADILELSALGRQFDVIESCGVLHHMADPMAGWKILADMLKPGGAMFIGLYSERARHQVTALRQFIAQHDYPATTDGIRRFRADALSGAHDIAIGELALSPDFNSTSACRDLLFHVQEHLYTPLKIQSNIDALGLKFLGFEIPYPEVKQRYAARFPENPAADSLVNWDLLEQDLPHAFAGMYQFWLRKEA